MASPYDDGWLANILEQPPRISRRFRAELALMAIGRYAYGQHVSDDRAFELRLRRCAR